MGLKWNELSEDEKHALVRLYNADKRGIDYDRYNATPAGLDSQIRRYRYSLTNSPGNYASFDTAIDDTKRWKQTLHNLTNKNKFIQVMHLADIHTPYHDEDALNLAYKIVEHVKPHVAIVGSDFADFALLSTFDIDPDTAEPEDQLVQFESYWNPHIHALDKAGAGALVFIVGNHEKRIIKYLAKQAPAFRKTIMSKFVDIIRCGGRVQWIGEVDRVTVGNTLVMHGNRYGVYPARGLLDDVGYQVNVMAGHNHKLSYFEKRGALYTVKGLVGGCLCELTPHYIRAGALRAKWQHGTCIADIHTDSRAANFDNLEFVPDSDGRLIARLGFTTIR